MTNTNELTAKLKAAAEKAGIEQWVNNRGEVNTADYEVDGGVYIDHICNCEIVGTESPQAEFIAMANPANILALTEALEAAESRIAELEESHAQVIEARDHWKRCATEGLSKLANARTLTVKLPQTIVLSELAPSTAQSFCHLHRNTVKACRNALEDACCAAGVKLQIEGE